MLLIAAANRLQTEEGGIENSCLNTAFSERTWEVAGPEFSDKEGMKALINKALCGVNTSGRKLWELLADVPRKIVFNPTRHDNNV